MTNSKGAINQTTRGTEVLDRLVDEIAQKLQTGEQVDVEAYVREHSEFEEKLRRLIPSMQVLADLGHSVVESSGRVANVVDDHTPVRGVLGDYPGWFERVAWSVSGHEGLGCVLVEGRRGRRRSKWHPVILALLVASGYI